MNKLTNDEKGKFHRLGLSNYKAWEVVWITTYMRRKKMIVPTVYQGMYNGITRMVRENQRKERGRKREGAREREKQEH